MTNLLDNLRSNLRSALEEKGFTQEGLSKQAGFHRSTVNKILNGSQTPSIPTVEQLAEQLETPAHELFKPPENNH